MSVNPVFILGIHKSGTSLLRSLIDGHQSFEIVPIEMHYFKHFKLPYEYPINNYGKHSKTIKESILSLIDEYNSGSNNYSDNNTYHNDRFKDLEVIDFNESAFDPTNFLKLSNYLIGKERDFENGKTLVEKSVDNLEYAELFSHMFPKAKFIHIIRNPYANFFALKQYLSRSTKLTPPVGEVISPLKYNSKYYFRNKMTIKNYKVITYENLVLNTREVMMDICEYLEVEYQDIMLKPTLGGKLWKGNSMSKNKYNEVSLKNADIWKDYLSSSEAKLIQENCRDLLNEFNFEIPNQRTKKLNLKTTLKTRFHNHFYKYFDHL